MANTYETLTSLFTDIADAIRRKTSETGVIVADKFPEAIAGIKTGSTLEDYWLWNHEFYNAPIEDLRYIAKLVGD